MESANELGDRKRKRSIQVVSILFAGALLFLTFFSNTLLSLTLPKVRTEPLAKGSLMFALEGSGTLQPFTEAKLTNAAGWKVRRIAVKVGDRVKKGQKLIEFDGVTAQRELENERASLKKMDMELQNLQDRYVQAAQGEAEFDIRSAGRAIESLKLDRGTQERKIDELTDRLASGRELVAPFDGTVTELNAVEGLASTGQPDVRIVNDSQGYRLDIAADSALLTRLGLSVGSKLDIGVQPSREQQAHTLEGTIVEVADAEPSAVSSSESGQEAGQTRSVPRRLLRIKVADPELKGGELAELKIDRRSRLEGLIVANEAIRRDQDGSFVYRIDEQRGALGNRFVARKVRIQSSESNDAGTLVQADSLNEGDLLILESGEPLQDGDRVRMQ